MAAIVDTHSSIGNPAAIIVEIILEVSVERSGLHTIKSLNSKIESGAKIEESTENINSVKNLILKTIGGGNTSIGGTGGGNTSINLNNALFIGDSLTVGLDSAVKNTTYKKTLKVMGATVDAVVLY